MLLKKLSIVSKHVFSFPSGLAVCMIAGVLLATLTPLFTGCAKITAPADIFPPATPAGFTLLGGGDGEAHFRWAKNAEPDFDKYKLYRAVARADSFRALLELRQTEYVDRFLEYETTYFYYITALDFAGNESPPSQILDVQPLNISSPAPPGNLLVAGRNNPTLGQMEMLLSWTPPNISDVMLYRIFRGAASDFRVEAASLIDSSASSAYRDQRVRPGDLFYYKITAIDRGRKTSLPSNLNSDRLLRNVALVSPANRTKFSPPFILSWSAVEHAAAYQVFVARGPMSDVIWSSKTINKEIVYAGPTLTANTIYYWWVGAFSKTLAPEINSFSEAWAFFIE